MTPTLEEIYLYGVGFLSLAIVAYHFSESRKLSHIPAVGYDNPILSYISAIKFFFHSHNILLDVGSQYKSSIVKVPLYNGWYLVANNQSISEEMRKLPENVLSFNDALEEIMLVKYTMGQNISENPYHIPIVRNQLTRSIANMIPSLQNEVIAAFQDNIPPSSEWVKYPVMDSFIKIIARTSNRIFVGLPLCRNPEFLDIGTNFAIDVMQVVYLVGLLPSFLKPIAAKMLSKLPTRIRQAKKFLEPVIDERRKNTKSDFLSWLMDQAGEAEKTTDNLTSMILAMNFAAIHTTTLTFAQVLFDMAAHPEYIQPLRDEIETAITAEGWSKNALNKMKMLDSTIKESQRLHPMSTLIASRKVMQDHTFRDGTFVPKGSVIGISASGRHHDNASFANPNQFDPFRFVKANEIEGINTRTNEAVLVSFGTGKHICPGRHYALSSIKLMLAHLFTFYDVKLEDGKQRPADIVFGAVRIPSQKGAVLIRSRKH